MFETKTECAEVEMRYGSCIKCNKYSGCKLYSNNVRIERMISIQHKLVNYAYDLCDDCIGDLLLWLGERNGSDKPIDEKTS